MKKTNLIITLAAGLALLSSCAQSNSYLNKNNVLPTGYQVSAEVQEKLSELYPADLIAKVKSGEISDEEAIEEMKEILYENFGEEADKLMWDESPEESSSARYVVITDKKNSYEVKETIYPYANKSWDYNVKVRLSRTNGPWWSKLSGHVARTECGDTYSHFKYSNCGCTCNGHGPTFTVHLEDDATNKTMKFSDRIYGCSFEGDNEYGWFPKINSYFLQITIQEPGWNGQTFKFYLTDRSGHGPSDGICIGNKNY